MSTHWQPGSIDLPASGVTAGTYGDGTHVGRVTVAASGLVTAASSVAITGGGAAAGLVSLYDQTLGAAAATLDTGAAGIASGHGTLIISLFARTAGAVVSSEDVQLVFNADTAGNYYRQRLRANNTSAAAATQTGGTGLLFTATTTLAAAGVFGSSVTYIPNYDTASFPKTGNVMANAMDTTAANMFLDQLAFLWNNTAAISRAALSVASGNNLLAGTRMTIYGTQ